MAIISLTAAAAAVASLTTPGTMRLDAAMHYLDSMSSMQLYAIIVGLTLVIATAVLRSKAATLNNSNNAERLLLLSSERATNSMTPSAALAPAKKRGPEPKWHIFKWVNLAAVAVFGWSVTDFTLHCSAYLNSSDTLLKFLAVWSVFLCYCFGFFGISFVHDAIVVAEDEQKPAVRGAAASDASR